MLMKQQRLTILKLIIEKHPETVRHVIIGEFPIHKAFLGRSPAFCRVLIEADPVFERTTDQEGMLPLHCECMREMMMPLYPDAINRQ